MKNLNQVLMLILCICYSCGDGDKIQFEEIGHYKGDDEFQINTYYITSPLNLQDTMELAEIEELVEEHGRNMSNSSGATTATFYFFNKNETPAQLEKFDSHQLILDTIYKNAPYFAVWIMPNGEVNFFDNNEIIEASDF